MNKQPDNKLALSVVATLTAGIAVIYILIAYPQLIFAVAGVSAIFLICAYILTQNIVNFINMKNKSLNVQIKNGMDDLSTQIEGMSSAQAQLGKATYIYTRQAAENVATLRGNYADSQEALHKNLSVLANAQNKSTKLLIKYDQSNTTKLISTLKDMRNHLNETLTQGFDQMQQPNNADVVAMLESIVDYLKSQPAAMDQNLGMQINNVAHELQNISSNIARVQSVPMQAPPMGMQVPPMGMSQPVYQQAVPTPEPITEPVIEETPVAEPAPEPVIEEAPAAEPEPQPESVATAPVSDDPNKQLSADEIAALFAATDGAPEPEPVQEDAAEESFTPTFTVVGKDDNVEPEAAPEPEPVAAAPVSDDPNKQLSADEIAALFAAAEPAPKKEEPAPEPEPVAAAPVSDDPNKQLSADEIAALFAAAEPAPKKEEPAPEPEPVAVTPVSDDPNKQLSPDEIAALFASIG